MFYFEGGKLKKLPVTDQGFEWTHCVVRCQYYNFQVYNVKTMYQRAKSERHRKKVKLRGKDRNQLLEQLSLGCLHINQKGTYVDDAEN